MRLPEGVILLALVCLCYWTSADADTCPEYRRICYYTNWAQYRPDEGRFLPENIDGSLCTHIMFAFAVVRDCKITTYEFNDEEMYQRVLAIKSKWPHLKVSLAVGGWNFGTKNMTLMLATEDTRAYFIKTSIEFIRDRGFDGVDLDFEYPGSRGSPPGDKQRFTKLCQEMRAAFESEALRTGQKTLLLTAAVGAGESTIENGYEIVEISQELDFLTLMAYDLNGAWQPWTAHNAPMYSRSDEKGRNATLNVEWAANTWVSKGCPREKLVIGLALYGRNFELQDINEHGMVARTLGPAPNGTYTREEGFWSYYEICEMLAEGSLRQEYNKEQEVPYAWGKEPYFQTPSWVGYDDIQSLRIKTRWIIDNGFSGVMMWTLDNDIFRTDLCPGQTERYPLIKTINEELVRGCKPVTHPTPDPGHPEYRRVCYYTNWAQYRPEPGTYFPEDIDGSLCTNIMYAFAVLENNHIKMYEWNDEIMYKRVLDQRKRNPHLKVSLAIGGWNHGTAEMTKMLATRETRADFIESSIEFLHSFNFDGIDLDFEYPGSRGSPLEDKHKFTQLCQEMRAAFNREPEGSRLLLTAALGAGKDTVDAGYEVEAVTKELDFFSLMTYDLNGAWQPWVAHNSPLFPREGEEGKNATLNVAWAAEYMVSKGAPRDKMMIGLPLYGRNMELAYIDQHTPGSPNVGSAPNGTFTRESGFWSYYEICMMLADNTLKKEVIPEQWVPYAYGMVQNVPSWVGYDDHDSLMAKVDWLKSQKYGGVMIWTLDNDNFQAGLCGPQRYPLIRAIMDRLNSGGGNPPTQPPSGAPTSPPSSGPTRPHTSPTPPGGKGNRPDCCTGRCNTCADVCLTCPEGIHGHPQDLSKFCQCGPDRDGHDQDCPPGLIFYPDRKICDWPIS